MYIENRDIDIIENKYSSLPICSRLPVYHRVGSNLRRSAFFFHSLSLSFPPPPPLWFYSPSVFYPIFFLVYFLIIPRYFLCRASIKIQLTELNRFRALAAAFPISFHSSQFRSFSTGKTRSMGNGARGGRGVSLNVSRFPFRLAPAKDLSGGDAAVWRANRIGD